MEESVGKEKGLKLKIDEFFKKYTGKIISVKDNLGNVYQGVVYWQKLQNRSTYIPEYLFVIKDEKCAIDALRVGMDDEIVKFHINEDVPFIDGCSPRHHRFYDSDPMYKVLEEVLQEAS